MKVWILSYYYSYEGYMLPELCWSEKPSKQQLLELDYPELTVEEASDLVNKGTTSGNSCWELNELKVIQ